MKKINIILSLFVAMTFLFMACDPKEDVKPDIGPAPTADQLGISITPGSDEFHVIVTNTSTVVGIPSWNFGNGAKSSEEEVEVKYNLAGVYTITLTLVTKGGSATISVDYEQPVTDFSIFTDPIYINLSGGMDAVDGKTWVLDSTVQGHLGVGPAGTVGLQWWSAAPLAKKGAAINMYDDAINLNINEFAAILTNNGKSYVKGYAASNPAYSNPTVVDTDSRVDYDPSPGTWNISEIGGEDYLILSGPTPMFPCFDIAAKDGQYKILSLTENLLELVGIDGVEGNAWHYFLIPQGYVKPAISFTLNTTEGVNNDVTCSTTAYSIPAGESVTNVTWNFGDGSAEYTTATKDEVVHHTFMRKGTYVISAKANTTLGLVSKTNTMVLANNNSAYVDYLLNEMVMYNDFGETMLADFTLDGAGTINIVSNPNKTVYPNRSSKCAFYSKTAQQWTNAQMKLPTGYRFDLGQQHTFKVLVYGKAGDKVLFKLENTDKGGNAWQTGAESSYFIQKTNTWEVATYNFAGVGAGWNWTGDIFTSDITTDPNFNTGFYNVLRIFVNPDIANTATHSLYFDEVAGPHVEGLK